MSERFNGRSAEVLATTPTPPSTWPIPSNATFKVYNQHIPQKALGHSPPLQAMKYWSRKQTQLFKKCVYNLAGLDIGLSEYFVQTPQSISLLLPTCGRPALAECFFRSMADIPCCPLEGLFALRI